MSCATLPPGCSQEQLDAALGFEPEIEATEEEQYAEYVEKILASAHLAPPNVFWECAPQASARFAARRLSAGERAELMKLIDELTTQDLEWVSDQVNAAERRVFAADIERDEVTMRKPAARTLFSGRAA